MQLTAIAGWKEFLNQRKKLLDRYDEVKAEYERAPVKTEHGVAAEALVREFLATFLPKQFGVTSGYLISQGMPDTAPLLHYDVIIYDALNAPTLWVSSTPDHSEQGKKRAIPVEYVHGLLEVKARLTKSSANAAAAKLQEVDPLLEWNNSTGDEFPVYLHRDFWRGAVFMELFADDANHEDLLGGFVPLLSVRGFYGLYVARGEGLADESARIQLLAAEKPFRSKFVKDNQTFLQAGTYPASVSHGQALRHQSLWIDWSEDSFVRFFFGLLHMMQGQTSRREIPTFHGMSGKPVNRPLQPDFE